MDNNKKEYDAIESIMRLSRALRRQPPPPPSVPEMPGKSFGGKCRGGHEHGECGRGSGFMRGPGGVGGFMPPMPPMPPESVRRLMKALSGSESGEGVSSRELAELLDIRPSSLTELLARAEKMGVVTRPPDESDKRVVRVKLSEEGAKAVSLAEERRRTHLEQMTACFTPEEHRQFCELCDKLCAHIESLSKADSAEGDGGADGFGCRGRHGHGPGGFGRGRMGHMPPPPHFGRPPFPEPPFGGPPFGDIPPFDGDPGMDGTDDGDGSD